MRTGAALGSLLLALTACASSPSTPTRGDEVRIAGSDTMAVLNRRLAEGFMRTHPGVAVRVWGGGTATGLDALLAGEAEIWAASRPPAPEEVRRLYQRFETLGVTWLVARDALSVYLNPDNPVRSLSSEQLRDVFSGRLRVWSEVGGGPSPIRVLIRPPTSGTHRFFRDHVLKDLEYREDAEMMARTADIVAAVRGDADAVGYGGAAYGSELVHCAVDGVDPPTAASADDGRYPLGRHLTYVTPSPPSGWVKRFIEWTLGPEGQRVVEEVGYLPLWRPAPRAQP